MENSVLRAEPGRRYQQGGDDLSGTLEVAN